MVNRDDLEISKNVQRILFKNQNIGEKKKNHLGAVHFDLINKCVDLVLEKLDQSNEKIVILYHLVTFNTRVMYHPMIFNFKSHIAPPNVTQLLASIS